MPLVVTDAIILHAADYLESSRLLRLATREFGVLSVVARGARSSRKRFGPAVGLFAIGQAQLDMRPGRDMHTLTGFDVANAQAALATDLTRFSAASALAESAMRVVHDESAPAVYAVLLDAFGALGAAGGDTVIPTALGAFWRLVREVGFAPVLDDCAECHEPLPPDLDVTFSHSAGGVLCPRCARRAPGGRRLPASARAAITGWLQETRPTLSRSEGRAHQRLLREFLGQHLTDGRPLRAFADWEAGTFEPVEG